MPNTPATATVERAGADVPGAPRVEPVIRVHGLTKAFRDTPVLHGVSLEVEAGRLVALLGPSGCGKTTLLRLIAGLERPDRGSVAVAGRVLSDAGDGAGARGPKVFVPPEQRRIGMVFQDWALFPHLNVGRNVAYGLARGPGRDERVAEALAMVGLAGLDERMPGTLSGGQQQRVALARAIAPHPEVLLLDEPFSNLDASLRVRVRSELHELLLQLGITTVFVTHDQEEAFTLGDEVAVMRDGLIIQQAAPAELYRRPVDPWVADFVGEANLLPAVVTGGTAETVLGSIPLAAALPDGAASVLVRPEELRILTDAEGVAAAGVPGTVELVEFFGHDAVHVVRLAGGERVRVRAAGAPRAARGDEVALARAAGPAVAFAAAAPASTSGT